MKKPPVFLLLAIALLAAVLGQLGGARSSQAAGPAFTDIVAGLPGVIRGDAQWGDYDSDGDLDVVVVGATETGRVSEVFRNDGSGSFEDIDAGLVGVSWGSVDWGDYDGDGDLDLVLAGEYADSDWVSSIYRNNGDDTFTDIDAGLYNSSYPNVLWGDYDGDGDLDVLQQSSGTAGIFRNDGTDDFTRVPTAFDGIWWSAAWGDYDADGDLDVLVAGNSDEGRVARIYRNDGDGDFTDIEAGLPGVYLSSADWGDYDSDGDLDALVTGHTGSVRVTALYRNDGDDTFTDSGASLPDVSSSDADWGDCDSDGDLDLVLTGDSGLSPVKTTKIFQQNEATFDDIGASLDGVNNSSARWGDYDGDGDLDLLLSGDTGSGYITKIYRNESAPPLNSPPSGPANLNSFVSDFEATLYWDASSDSETSAGALTYNVRVGTSPGESDTVSPMALVGGDDDGVRLVAGMGNAGQRTSYTLEDLDSGTYYWSVQAIDNNFAGSTFADEGSFTVGFSDIEAGLTGVYLGSAVWGDYDSDGDLDVLVTGDHAHDVPVTEIYRNDDGEFTDIDAGLSAAASSSAAWGDYDSDGDLDVLLTGETSTGVGPVTAICTIYRNDGDDVFTEIDAGLSGSMDGSATWSDYDSDGDLDILVTGSSYRPSELYRNDGSEGFAEIADAGLTGVMYSSAAWGDYDTDGDLDLLLTGLTAADSRISTVFRNDGSGGFTDIEAGLNGVYQGSANWGDYDADGDLDIVLTGFAASGVRITKVYRNDGGAFTDIDAGLTGLGASSAAWGDYDGDGNLDIVAVGSTASGDALKVYRNAGSDEFVDIGADLPGVHWSSVAWGDCDSDDDLDILVTGITGSSERTTRIFRNETDWSNFEPDAPTGLDSSVAGGAATLSWTSASDFETVSAGLTYNLRIGTEPGGSDVLSPMALTDGIRLVPRFGTVSGDTSFTLKNLHGGTYYWSVQTIDNSLAGSSFADERSFTLPPSIFAFSQASYSSSEAGPSATITINRTGTTTGTDSVHVATSNGTAQAGSDYTAVSQTVSFSPGQTVKTVSIPITDDSSIEGSETVSLTLSSPSTGATLGNPSSAALAITDNDTAPPPTTTTPTDTTTVPTAGRGKITAAKLSKKSFKAATSGKVKLTVKFAPRSKVFRCVLSIKKGKKWQQMRALVKRSSLKSYTTTVKKLFAGKAVKKGQYRLKLSADANSRTLSFRVA